MTTRASREMSTHVTALLPAATPFRSELHPNSHFIRVAIRTYVDACVSAF